MLILMEFDRGKLEKWASDIPKCEEFLTNFFESCRDDLPSAFENYIMDIESYSKYYKSIKENRKNLFDAFYDIAQMKVYYG